jgi:hypothetical protein
MNQAKVRSTTERRGKTLNPVSERFTTWTVSFATHALNPTGERLAVIAAIDAEQTQPGEDKDTVYSLVLRAHPLQKQRLHLVSALDQHGREVKLLEHRGQDYAEQALFLQPERDAEKVRLTFSLTASRFVRFRARPEFVEH